MLCSMPFVVLEQILSEAEKQPAPARNCRENLSRKRGFCGHSPYAQNSPPELQILPSSLRQLEVRELDDAYVLFLDMPGFSRSDVNITVEGDSLHISAPDCSIENDLHKPGPSKDLLVERPRGGIKRSWRLPKDAMLDGIHAKLHNGELTIILPKRKAFSVPVLGPDTSDSAALPEPAKESAPALQASQAPMIEPAPTVEAPVEPPQEPEHALEATHVPMTEPVPAVKAPAEPLNVPEPEPAVTTPTAPGPVTLSEALKKDADMADVEESDGSIEDVSDEEREDYAAARRAKGKLPLEGPVLEEIERQEAEMKMQHDSDSD
ncbi:probable spore protein SP21 at N-terminal half [Coccomyxa sp. Obi]|nr:probable spore protein SP21 at N-terminal half [Coccomyxa sp. Obi]